MKQHASYKLGRKSSVFAILGNVFLKQVFNSKIPKLLGLTL